MGFQEKGVLRRIFGPKRDEITGEWRRLQKEELYDLYEFQTQREEIRSKQH
jgi:hypothetical protein